MSRRSKEIHEIEIFMDGLASVCDESAPAVSS